MIKCTITFIENDEGFGLDFESTPEALGTDMANFARQMFDLAKLIMDKQHEAPTNIEDSGGRLQ